MPDMIVPRKKPQKADLATVRCQKCLTYGHYTYECKNKRKIVIRESRTKILNKNLKKKAEGGSLTASELPPVKKSKKTQSPTGSSSSSSDSESDSSSSSSSSSSSDSDSSSTSSSSSSSSSS